jgi:hypothetical protein
MRPDVIGGIVARYGDGEFTQAVYFTSEAAARENEKAMEQDDLGRDYLEMIDGTPTFFDLTELDID